MTVSYSRRWNDVRKKPMQPIQEDEARRMHEAGQPYVAYVHGVDARRDAVVEVALFSPTVVVYFLDERGKRTIHYAFRSDGQGGLFLDEFGWRNYAHDGQITLSEIHRFSEDGSVSVARTNATTDRETTWEEKLEDTALLLEPIPAFGDYESITRFERVHGDVAGSPDPFSGRI
ncbi:MAG: hypothetical protein LC733_05935 [Actinobacteria bacterium]|nr:hypothetical protein [Actinomycetota bacterium]